MTDTRKVIEIDVSDAAFKRFAEAFAKFQEAVKDTKKDTKDLGDSAAKGATKAAKAAEDEREEVKKTRKAKKDAAQEDEVAQRRSDTAKAKMQQRERQQAKEAAKARSDAEKADKKQRDAVAKSNKETIQQYKSIAKWTGQVAWNTGKSALNIAKWLTVGGLVGGFGLGGLAASAAGARRQAQGVGIDTGSLRAANLNFGKYIDPASTLENIAGAQSDLSKRWIFGALGQQTQGKTPGELLPEMLPKIIQAFRAGGSTLQGANARGLTDLVGIDDLRRLSSLNENELRQTIEDYKRDRAALNVNDNTSRSWQQFLVALDRAGNKIEVSLIQNLTKLAPKLGDFADIIAKDIDKFLSNPDLGKWIDQFAQSIENAAKFLGSKEFEEDINRFIRGLKGVAHFLGKFIGDDGAPTVDSGVKGAGALVTGGGRAATSEGMSLLGKVYSGIWHGITDPLSVRNHNPGNLRVPGSTTKFQSFGNDDDGIKALANQLRLYENRDGLDTISKIISKYSPGNENNTKMLIQNAAFRTGIGANDKLDAGSVDQLVKLILAITKQENQSSNFTADKVKLLVQNSTGGNATTSLATMGASH